ncbi:MAG: ferredoxin, partial [Thiomonas sp. 14-66-4]
MTYYKHHVFFCLNRREEGRACCAARGAEEAF